MAGDVISPREYNPSGIRVCSFAVARECRVCEQTVWRMEDKREFRTRGEVEVEFCMVWGTT